MFWDVTSYGFVAQKPTILMFISTVMMEEIPSSVSSVRTSNRPQNHIQKYIFVSVVMVLQSFLISLRRETVFKVRARYDVTFQSDLVGVTRGLHC